jgi:hypothetical protein
MGLLWPSIDDEVEARAAILNAAAGAFFIAAFSGAIGTLSLLLDHPILGFDERAFRDAIVFAFVGWGIRRASRIAAAFGFTFWLFEAAERYIARPGSTPNTGLVLTVLLMLYLLHGVRGAFLIQRLSTERKVQAANVETQHAASLLRS